MVNKQIDRFFNFLKLVFKKSIHLLIPWCTIKNSNITQKYVSNIKGENHGPSIIGILIRRYCLNKSSKVQFSLRQVTLPTISADFQEPGHTTSNLQRPFLKMYNTPHLQEVNQDLQMFMPEKLQGRNRRRQWYPHVKAVQNSFRSTGHNPNSLQELRIHGHVHIHIHFLLLLVKFYICKALDQCACSPRC